MGGATDEGRYREEEGGRVDGSKNEGREWLEGGNTGKGELGDTLLDGPRNRVVLQGTTTQIKVQVSTSGASLAWVTCKEGRQALASAG